MLLCCGLLINMSSTQAQQRIATDIVKNTGDTYNTSFSTTYVNYGDIFKDRIDLKELASGQSGYAEFTIDHFTNVDIGIGLINGANTTQSWMYRFINGEITINGVSYGACLAGSVYRVERCDASIKYYVDGVVILEVSLNDINFAAYARVDVTSADLDGANKPRVDLQFPFLNNCHGTPPGIVSTAVYADLKKQLDASYIRLTGPSLRFKYHEEYAIVAGQNSSLDYKIYDWNKGTPNQQGSLTKVFGINYMTINLSTVGTNKYYTLEVADSKGEKYYLRFLYYCPPGQECVIFPPDSVDKGGDQIGAEETEEEED